MKPLILICKHLTETTNQNNQQQQNDHQQPQNNDGDDIKHEQKSSPTPGGYKKPIFLREEVFVEALKERGFSDDIVDKAIILYQVKHNDNIQR